MPLALRSGLVSPSSSCSVTRHAISPTCAFNPDGGKPRPIKKKKSKEPKQKVKGPPTSGVPGVVAEKTFYEGPPSITETLIPGLSVFTVVGIIPFSASLARQAWTRYKITNRRLEVKSGFQGKDLVQVTWSQIEEIRWLRRFGGQAGDCVFFLTDGSKLEVRSMAEFDRNLNYMMTLLGEEVADASNYPDGPAKEFLAKVASGDEPAVELPSEEAADSEA